MCQSHRPLVKAASGVGKPKAGGNSASAGGKASGTAAVGAKKVVKGGEESKRGPPEEADMHVSGGGGWCVSCGKSFTRLHFKNSKRDKEVYCIG